MGDCPCPRCLIPKDRTHQLGTKRDQRWRKTHARVDNLHYRAKISSARNIIYKNNRTVNSVFVERLLKPQSLVPNDVCSFMPPLPILFGLTIYYLTECILSQTFSVWIQLVQHLSGRLHA